MSQTVKVIVERSDVAALLADLTGTALEGQGDLVLFVRWSDVYDKGNGEIIPVCGYAYRFGRTVTVERV
jgi:hypothetical protein